MTYRKLQNGDIVDIIAPSSSKDVDLKAIADIVRGFGLTPRIPDNMLLSGVDPFSANTDEFRFNQLKQAIYTEDSKVIWAFRGGYGAGRLIPSLHELPLPMYPKILIGYSDITALHIICTQKYGWSTLHGRTLSEFIVRKTNEAEISAMKEALFGRVKATFNNLKLLNTVNLSDKEIKSEVVGGNLALIQTSLGTPWQFNADNKIVLLEDVDERGYSIDRMLTHLTHAGIFDKALAVMIGDIMCNPEKDGTMLCDMAVARFANSLNIPVLSCSQVGHGEYNWPVPFNMPAILTLGELPTLVIDTFR
ncbi:MAG: LD-carboxypeptidase [Alphaproteobacteria bacterium]|jgi:muramoyltetrapeptide carboxypeptidase